MDSPEGRDVKLRLEGIGYGFLIPIYFVTTGMSIDVASLLSPSGAALAALFLVLLLVVRGVSALLWLGAFDARGSGGVGFCAATGLPLIVAIVGIGAEHGGIDADVGASLVGAGVMSVLVYPLIATALLRGARQCGPTVAGSGAASRDAK